MRKIVICSVFCFSAILTFVLYQNFSSPLTLTKIIDSSLGDSTRIDFTYSYAPSMVLSRDGKTIHTFVCSTGYDSLGMRNWDAIRYTHSNDGGKTWSIPEVVLHVSDPINERATCDPSVVYFGDYYYLYYTGNKLNTQSAVFVARSKNIEGPYLKYTLRNTWEANPPDPKIVIHPRNPAAEGMNVYGAGEQTVIVKDKKIYMWHNDTSADLAHPIDHIYFQTTTNPVVLNAGIATNVSTNDLSAGSIDIKYDPITAQFVMYNTRLGHYQNARIQLRYSKDGITWSSPIVICDEDCTPDFINNIGALGTPEGFLLPGKFLAYGAPYDLRSDCNEAGSKVDKYCWAHWDLYGGLYSNMNSIGGNIKGYIDGVIKTTDGVLVKGWACADGAGKSIGVHVYLRNDATGDYKFIAAGVANQPSESAVSSSCSDSLRYHRYTVKIPNSEIKANPGKAIVVYGLSPYGLNNLRLINSAKYIP